MRIKEIELDNFKSFGRRTTIPLLNGFTTISGPNGSGKSNIVDSLLFALGLSSTRSMRAERLPDLLNNLSGKNEAKVTVRFTDGLGNELEVVRRIRVKDNGYTSTYMLNGKNTTLTEIHDELMKYNVSPTGFNVIMQGDVTGIVSMSPTERRKIIDELAGVADFDRRIDQANDELSAVGEKIDHQRIILAEIASRLELLQQDRDQALKYLDLKTQKEQIERDLMFVRVKETEAKVASELKRLEKFAKQEESLLESREKAEIDRLSLRSEMGRIDEEIREKGGHEQLLLRQELENLRGDLTREENKLSNLTGVIGEKTKIQKNVQAQIQTIEKHLSQLARKRKQFVEEQQTVEKVLFEKQGSLSAVQAEIEVLRQEKDRSADNMVSTYGALQDLRDKKHKVEVQKTELTTRKESLEREIETLRNAVTDSIGKSAQSKSQVQSLESKHRDQQALVLGIERTIRQLDDEMESTREDIEQRRKELESVNRRLIELETHREVSGEGGFGKAVDAILKAGIDGVHGTIGQLGAVPDEYKTALEVAIGPRLGHIVVEDDQVAQECIDFLKQNPRLGRATFVPLSKIQTQPPGYLPERPGVIDFAFNLINFDPRFTKAIQYACGQTIVVENMECARRLINQARMVTLEGELFEKSGAISGGHDNKSKMHFASKGENDLSVVQAKAAALAESIRNLQDGLKELAVALNEERTKLQDASADLAEKRAELDTKRQQAESLEKQIEDYKPRLRNSGDEIEGIDKKIEDISQTLKKLDKEITQLQDNVTEASGTGKRTKIEKLISEAEELQQEVTAVEANFQEVQREIDRIDTEAKVEQGNRDNLQLQLDEITLEVNELSVQTPVHETKIAELRAQIHQIEQKSGELSEELDDLRKQKDEIHEKVTALEIEKTKIEQDLLHLEEERQKSKLYHYDLEQELVQLKAELEQIIAEQPDWQPPSEGTVEQLRAQVDRLEKRMRALEPVNMKALEEYNTVKERQDELDVNLQTLTEEKDEITQRIAGYDELKKRTFMESFDAINTNFQEIFAELSHGHGKLELENPENPFAGGLIIRAQPRDKKMQRIEALSGGEKSLTALSFVFAFQRYAPAPFYAFDEVDMMLDGSNADRLARMVKRQSEHAQFVVVSLRRPMIENADHAVGVSLRSDGYSRVVGIQEIQIPETEPEAQGVGA
jgi:chromosome segregation protein